MHPIIESYAVRGRHFPGGKELISLFRYSFTSFSFCVISFSYSFLRATTLASISFLYSLLSAVAMLSISFLCSLLRVLTFFSVSFSYSLLRAVSF
ncbi:hypothetical protein MOUN0_N12332 [Monosporozyma unispora]